MGDRIIIEKTPKLGSPKEALKFVRTINKEEINYHKKLSGESIRRLRDTLKVLKYQGVVKHKIKKNETPQLSPELLYDEKKYVVLRYGPSFFQKRPPDNYPTGFTVFTSDKTVLYDVEKCKEICKIYKIWEYFYYNPIKISMSETLNNWKIEIKTKIYDNIVERQKGDYSEFIGSEEELGVLKELDNEVFEFHNMDIEMQTLVNRLAKLQFDIFEFPSETNINEVNKIVFRFQELMSFEKQYLDRRIKVWKKYRSLLEQKYSVKVNLDFSMTELGMAAFFDLIKYVLFKRKIPESIIARVSIEVLKDISNAKVSEALLNLLVHYGGLTALENQLSSYSKLVTILNSYRDTWETEIPTEMIRFP